MENYEKQRGEKNNKHSKGRRTTIMVLVVLTLTLFIIGDVSAKWWNPISWFEDTSEDILKEMGIDGMRIEDFSVDGKKTNKLDYKENNYELRNEFKLNKDKNKIEVKQDIWLTNKKGKKKFEFSTIIEIDYSEIRWNGTRYALKNKALKLTSWYNEYNSLVVPNIFMDDKFNKRINYKDVAEKGGYALAYKKGNKYYIELRIDNLDIEFLEEYYIDPTYENQTTGFDVSGAGVGGISGLTTNGSDFWVADDAVNRFIYHFNKSGDNQTDGFEDTSFGGTWITGLCTNGSSIWALDRDDDFVYKLSMTGVNQSGGFSVGVAGANLPIGMACNGTDFYVNDDTDKFTYHFDISGANQSDGFSVQSSGAASPFGLALELNEFWYVDDQDDFVYHFNSSFDNQTDGFNVAVFGASVARRIDTNGSDFWIGDVTDGFIYHIINLNFSFIDSPVVTLNNPPDNNQTINNDVFFNCSATGSTLLNNISLFINGLLNETLTGSSTLLELATTKGLVNGEYIWNCDSVNVDNVRTIEDNRTLFIGLIQSNETFNTNVTETSNQNFRINISLSEDILSLTAILNYSGEKTIGTTNCVGTNCVVSTSIDIPLINTEIEIKNFSWILTIFDGTSSTNISTSINNQEVSRIHLEQCNATWKTKTLNFTAYDEQNLSRVNPFQFNGNFDFWVGEGTVFRNNSFSKNITEMDLCLSPNVTMKTDAIIDYDESENLSLYTNRFYYLDSHNINNVTQNIRMYLLKSTSSTSFILKVQDENLLPVANAIIEIHRFYPGEGIFRIVQIAKTDDNGKSIGFFETETVDYKFVIKKAGVTLLSTGSQKVIPETSPFTLTFNTGTNLGEPWASQNEIPRLNSSLNWNSNTAIATYTYVDTSGNFTNARLLVQKISLVNTSAYLIICNDTSSISSSTITCNVGNTTGFYIASSFITRTNEGLDKQISFQIEDFSSVVGLLGLFFGIFLIVIASFMFKFSEVAGIWSVTITIFLVNLMGLIKFGAVFVTAIIGISVILTWVMEK